MTPQELKASILQLAIQGKLVEQRPEEGTGAELLEKIFAAKNTGKNLTRRRGERGGGAALSLGKNSAHSAPPREEILDTPFDIPESWVWVRLGEVMHLLSGRDLEPSEYSQEVQRYPYMTGASNFVNGRLIVNRWTERAVTVSHKGDLLITCKGTIGAMAFNDIGDVHIARQIMAISSDWLNLSFVKNLLESMVAKLQIAANSMIPGISREVMLNLAIPLPPLAEQKRIVAKIEELLPLIDRYEKAWGKLEDFNRRFPVDMQKSLLQMAIQGKLVEQRSEEGTGEELLAKISAAKDAGKNLTRRRGERGGGAALSLGKYSAPSAPPREEILDSPFDIPENWVWVRLEDILLDVSTGPFGSMLHKADYCDGGIPLVNPMNIQNGRIVPSDIMRVSTKTAERLSSYRLSEGMVVVARRGELGRCASVEKGQEGWLCGTGSFFLSPSRELFVPFMTLIISSPYARQLFAGKAVGTTMANLNHHLLKAMPFPLPPLAEQKRIVAKLEELLPLCERLK